MYDPYTKQPKIPCWPRGAKSNSKPHLGPRGPTRDAGPGCTSRQNLDVDSQDEILMITARDRVTQNAGRDERGKVGREKEGGGKGDGDHAHTGS
jgi:hypothetical protein